MVLYSNPQTLVSCCGKQSQQSRRVERRLVPLLLVAMGQAVPLQPAVATPQLNCQWQVILRRCIPNFLARQGLLARGDQAVCL